MLLIATLRQGRHMRLHGINSIIMRTSVSAPATQHIRRANSLRTRSDGQSGAAHLAI